MKNIFLLLTAFLFGLNIFAQESISTLFIAMPDTILIGLEAEQRVALTSHPDSTEITVTNILDDEIVRTALTENFIALKTSEVGTAQFMQLPLVNKTNIIGLIRTVCTKVCDSQIEFFTTDWQPVEQPDLFPVIDKSMFLRKDVDTSSENYKNATASLDMTPVKLTFLPDQQSISAAFDIKGYLSADDYKLIQPFLINEPLVFKWDKFSFK